jgi:nicotinamide-nucleotide amidase
MTCALLSVGDELVLGQTLDTNAPWVSTHLAEIGISIITHVTVADDQPAIVRALTMLAELCDHLIVTGGIGPTPDDLTRQALAESLGQPLEIDQAWLNRLRAYWQSRNSVMPEINRIQAMIPRGGTLLHNPLGTAAGIRATLQIAGRQCTVYCLPGVPKEMTAMFDLHVLPILRGDTGKTKAVGGHPREAEPASAVILSRTLHTFGLGESAVAERLGDLMRRGRNPSVGTTVSGGIVTLRINSRFDSRPRAAQELQHTIDLCRQALGDLIFAQDDQTLATAVGELLSQRSAHGSFSVATAESCTGGLLAKLLTDVSGSSNYFRQGWVTYADQAKHDLLGVPKELIDQHGAVSEPVALAMAAGALDRAAADVAISITGIAGPTGGTPEKPVGTVWIALAAKTAAKSPDKAPSAAARQFLFPGDRDWVRQRSANMALTLLRYHLLNKQPPF